MKAKVKNMAVTFRNIDTAVISIDVDKSALEHLPSADKPLTVEITVEKKHRTLSQSAYMWVLLDKIARLLGNGTTKDALYLKYIKEAGVFDANTWIVPERYKAFKANWESRAMGNMCEIARERNGMYNIVCYFGTHYYNTKEMSFLLDHIISDAQEMGIQTLTPKERAKLLETDRRKT